MPEDNINILKILDFEGIGAYAWIVGSILLIIAVNKAKKEYKKTEIDEDINPNKEIDDINYYGFAILTISELLVTIAAIGRFIDRKEKIEEGKNVKGTLLPNILSSGGLIISTIGTFIATIGYKLRSDEDAASISSK